MYVVGVDVEVDVVGDVDVSLRDVDLVYNVACLVALFEVLFLVVVHTYNITYRIVFIEITINNVDVSIIYI